MKKENTLIIIDWDDTLFPSSWIKDTTNLIKLNDIDHSLTLLLETMKQLGNIIIVTNASMSWIEKSKNYLTFSRPILDDIEFISARDKYSKKYSTEDWKKQVFKDIISKKQYLNVISIGDAHYEYDALLSLKKIKYYKFLKNIRFIKRPKIEMLDSQIQLLEESLPQIVNLHRSSEFILRTIN